MKKFILITITCLMVFGGTAYAVSPSGSSGKTGPVLTEEQEAAAQHTKLITLKLKVLGLQETKRSGVITSAQADEAIGKFLAQAQSIAGADMTLDKLLSLTGDPSVPAQETKKLSWLQRAAGFVTFMNILWVFGIILGVVCLTFLFGGWVVDLMKIFVEIPMAVYEVLFYGAGGGFIFWGTRLSSGYSEYAGFAGCLMLAGAAGFTVSNHLKGKNITGILALITIVWAGTALLLSSSLIGFFAVGALVSTLGFSILVMPGSYALGYEDDEALIRGTVSSLMVLALFTGLEMAAADTPHLEVFKSGGIFLGAFVGFLGLLIISSKWYTKKNYVFTQVLTVILLVAAMYVGSTWHISTLQKIGGTFFALYLLEKELEIAAEFKEYWAYWGLITAGLITGAVVLIKSNMEFFAPYLPF